jgi:hypothetical protein
MTTLDERLARALTAQGEELWNLVRDPHAEVILNVTLNRYLTEEMAVFIAKKRNAPAEVLGVLAGDARFRGSYKLKLEICRNPRTAQRVVFSLLKFLRIFDLGDMTRQLAIPVTVRQKIEIMLAEKIPSLPSGVKSALARRSSSATVLNLMEHGDRRVVISCLESPAITEQHLCTLLQKRTVRPVAVRLIAEHPKWSLRYAVRYALIINFHTPMEHVTRLIPEMKTSDLYELYSFEGLPRATRPYIYSALNVRSGSAEPPREEIFEISEGDADDRGA